VDHFAHFNAASLQSSKKMVVLDVLICLDLTHQLRPRNEFTLPPEVVLFEPAPEDIHRGGTPAPQGKTGNRLIFLNVPLLDFEQKALDKLHEALKSPGFAENMLTHWLTHWLTHFPIFPLVNPFKGNVFLFPVPGVVLNSFNKVRNEKALAPGGTMPGYVRLHALRLLQQAKWKVEKAINTIATHLEMLNSKKLGFHQFHLERLGFHLEQNDLDLLKIISIFMDFPLVNPPSEDSFAGKGFHLFGGHLEQDERHSKNVRC